MSTIEKQVKVAKAALDSLQAQVERSGPIGDMEDVSVKVFFDYKENEFRAESRCKVTLRYGTTERINN